MFLGMTNSNLLLILGYDKRGTQIGGKVKNVQFTSTYSNSVAELKGPGGRKMCWPLQKKLVHKNELKMREIMEK